LLRFVQAQKEFTGPIAENPSVAKKNCGAFNGRSALAANLAANDVVAKLGGSFFPVSGIVGFVCTPRFSASK